MEDIPSFKKMAEGYINMNLDELDQKQIKDIVEQFGKKIPANLTLDQKREYMLCVFRYYINKRYNFRGGIVKDSELHECNIFTNIKKAYKSFKNFPLVFLNFEEINDLEATLNVYGKNSNIVANIIKPFYELFWETDDLIRSYDNFIFQKGNKRLICEQQRFYDDFQNIRYFWIESGSLIIYKDSLKIYKDYFEQNKLEGFKYPFSILWKDNDLFDDNKFYKFIIPKNTFILFDTRMMFSFGKDTKALTGIWYPREKLTTKELNKYEKGTKEKKLTKGFFGKNINFYL